MVVLAWRLTLQGKSLGVEWIWVWSVKRSILTPCQQKHTLLSAYLAALRAYNRHLRDHSAAMSTGGDSVAIKERAEASRDACRAIRKRYWEHVREHGC